MTGHSIFAHSQSSTSEGFCLIIIKYYCLNIRKINPLKHYVLSLSESEKVYEIKQKKAVTDIMGRHMCRKSFPLATFVRHLIPILPENNYSFPSGIRENQIAIGKGFSAHMPVINRIPRINTTPSPRVRIASSLPQPSSPFQSL